MSAPQPLTVLYFAGSGRSGTTIINSILGQVPGVFAAGELRYLWQRGVVEDHRCGCGQPFSRCPIWTDVMALVGRDGHPPSAQIARRLRTRLRIARLPLIALRKAFGARPVRAHRDDRHILALYQAVAAQTGARVIVDSSKLPPYGLLLERVPGIELRVLHVVRDPRATAFSWRRTKRTQDTVAGGAMQRMQVGKSSGLWLLWNLLADRWWPTNQKDVVRFRYEDFVGAPREHMTRIAGIVGIAPSQLPFVADDVVALAPTHSVAGNPNRHMTGEVQILGDHEWRKAMPLRDRLVVSALTLPGIIRFGYSSAVRHSPR